MNSAILLAQAAVSTSTSPQPRTDVPPANPLDQGPLASPSPQLPSVEALDQMFKQTPLGKAADEARLHAQWRELSNHTLHDADLVAARAHAEAASTDLEKRERLRAYYLTYFDRMRAKADSKELKDYLDARKAEYFSFLAQNRVRPGSSPPPVPAPAASPKQKHKKHSAAPEPSLPQ